MEWGEKGRRDGGPFSLNDRIFSSGWERVIHPVERYLAEAQMRGEGQPQSALGSHYRCLSRSGLNHGICLSTGVPVSELEK